MMNETDHDLLTWAAKAAGYKKYYSHHLGRDSFVTYDEEYYSEIKERRVVGEKTLDWNPITDDGDALRLMVKLGLGVSVPLGYKRTDVVAFSDSRINAIESHGSDPLAATRRAIVRAAAEIGRNMK